MAKRIATIDLKYIHEFYLQIKSNYPIYGQRFLYFLAAFHYIDPHIDLKTPLNLRSYGGLIAIDKSSLDNYIKSCKKLWLHAILHEASCVIAEYSPKVPGYPYVLSYPFRNEYLDHIMNCLINFLWRLSKTFRSLCWNGETRNSEIRLWRFSIQKTGFIIKELSLCSNNYADPIFSSAGFLQLTSRYWQEIPKVGY